jgi:RimJ/RimL family protein N-acetyltransferase
MGRCVAGRMDRAYHLPATIMQIRFLQPADLDQLADIDATVESLSYLHVDQSGAGLAMLWKIEERPLRSKLIASNPIDDDQRFSIRQIASGADEGIGLVAEHDGAIVALAAARPVPQHNTLALLDLRVDYDLRRQGIATAMLYQLLQYARDNQLRAVVAESKTNNIPACQLLAKCGFDLAGVDVRRNSNHDLVKESVTLFWYAALD